MSITETVAQLRAQVWDWLEGRLTSGTQVRYRRARTAFDEWLALRGIALENLAPTEVDPFLARYVLDTKEDEDSVLTKQGCVDLMATLGKRLGHPMRLCQQVLRAWSKEEPPRQAEAMPSAVAYAMVTTMAIVLKEPFIAIHVLLAYSACLRIGESLNLKMVDVVLPRARDPWMRAVLILRSTKRGFDQKVVLSNPETVRALMDFIRYFRKGADGEELLAAVSYSRFARAFRRTIALLELPAGEWRSHSLRRGAATPVVEAGQSFESVRQYGRWAAESSAREYIRLGQSAMMRMGRRISVERWRLYDILAAGAGRSFCLAANGLAG